MKLLKKASLLVLVVAFYACSGGGNQEEQKTETTENQSASATEEPKEQQVKELTIKVTGNTMQDMTFDQETITVPAGSKVKITLVNEAEAAAMIHNIVFVYEGTMEVTAKAALAAGPSKNYIPNSPTVIAGSPLAQPGETVTFEFDAPEAGNYEFICSYPGHWQQMNGKLIVE